MKREKGEERKEGRKEGKERKERLGKGFVKEEMGRGEIEKERKILPMLLELVAEDH